LIIEETEAHAQQFPKLRKILRIEGKDTIMIPSTA